MIFFDENKLLDNSSLSISLSNAKYPFTFWSVSNVFVNAIEIGSPRSSETNAIVSSTTSLSAVTPWKSPKKLNPSFFDTTSTSNNI